MSACESPTGEAAEVARYARQLILPGFDAAAQEAIRSARVHVVGAGPVAGPALLYLAAAGIGTLYVDDGDEVSARDAVAWVYGPDDLGQSRLLTAIAAIKRASAFVKARPYATGTAIDAALVCAATPAVARVAAERARTTGVPHVVALPDGSDGAVVSVPRGEPCFTCGSRPGSSLAAQPLGSAALGSLAAMELLLLVTGIVRGPGSGRRIELVAGATTVATTQRRPRCECATIH